MSPKAKNSGKFPFSHGEALVAKGHMTAEAFAAAVKDGTYRPDPKARHYGKDQRLYEQIQAVIDGNKAVAQEYNFIVVGKKK